MSAPIDWDEDMPSEEPIKYATGGIINGPLRMPIKYATGGIINGPLRMPIKYATGGIINGPLRIPSSGCVIDPDPSTEQWRKAMEQSTGARLRAALEANQELAAENERLRARIARQSGFYELTDKGRAATDPTVHQLVYGDDQVHCCGRTVAEVDAARDHTTLNPHAVTCRPEEQP